MIFHKNLLPAGQTILMNIKPYLLLLKKQQNSKLSSAADVIDALRIKTVHHDNFTVFENQYPLQDNYPIIHQNPEI